MTIEDKAIEYATNQYPSNQIERINAAEVGFEVGYNECKSDLIEFLKVNEKATVKQITEYLKTL